MKKVLRKSNLVAGVLVLIVVCLGIVLAGDVIVKEGVIEGEKFKSTGCTADGTKAVAFGYNTIASGNYSTAMGEDTTASGLWSTAMGWGTTASGDYSTAMGWGTEASGPHSTAMGFQTIASGEDSTAMGRMTTASGDYSTAMGFGTTASNYYTTAIGTSFTNNDYYSFAVGFGQKDFSVVSGLVTVHNNLYVTWDVDANTYSEHSTFYDKDTYGRALDYVEDSSKTIELNAEGKKEYNHEADPIFLQKSVTVTDYNTYTEEEVWDELLNKTITRRVYETHQEVRSDLSMKVAWLRQCVFELKQENQMLKDGLQRIKDIVGVE